MISMPLLTQWNNFEEWSELRCCFADALGNIGDDQAIPNLIQGLYHSAEPLPQHCARL